MKLTLKKLLSAVAFSLSSVLFAFGLAWVVLYHIDFSYGRWHDLGGIGEAIEKFGPQNYYRTGFAETTKAQRESLFQQINFSVHHDGVGLESIEYSVPGHPTQTLLTPDEVGHLTDVAHLINKVEWLVIVGVIGWLLMAIYYYRAGIKLPSVFHQCLALIVVMIVCVVLLLIIGPAKVFSQMHEWVFPPGHPWFFYYQQSLMSTMMFAPVLFGWIAIEWAVLTLFFFGVLQFLASRFLRRLGVGLQSLQ